MSINKEWHQTHPMPKNPSFENRVTWHLEHVLHCGCRKIPRQLAAEMARRGIDYPEEKTET